MIADNRTNDSHRNSLLFPFKNTHPNSLPSPEKNHQENKYLFKDKKKEKSMKAVFCS